VEEILLNVNGRHFKERREERGLTDLDLNSGLNVNIVRRM